MVWAAGRPVCAPDHAPGLTPVRLDAAWDFAYGRSRDRLLPQAASGIHAAVKLNGKGPPRHGCSTCWRSTVLYTLVVVLLVLWLAGLVTSFTAGGLLHILLVVAVVILIFQVISGRRVG